MEALDAAMIDHGKRIYVADAPPGAVLVHKEDWMAELFRRGILEQDDKNRWRDFKRLWMALVDRKLVATRDGVFWRVKEEKSS